MSYKLNVKPEVLIDIQEGVDWYNSRQPSLGKRFHAAVKQAFKSLSKSPFFQIRYNNIRCLPLKKFPYMVHFIVRDDSKQIIVLGVICSYKDPKRWEQRST